MKTKLFASALVAATAFASATLAITPVFPVNPQILQPLQPVLPPLIICPDLAVSVSYGPGATMGNLRATIRVTNTSPTNYQSSAGLQRVHVQRSSGFGVVETLNLNFTNLAHGATREWTIDRPLNGAPLTIDAALQVSPAVYADANPFNNECNAGNNTVHASS